MQEPWVAWSILFPIVPFSLSACECGIAHWNATALPSLPAAALLPCHESSPPDCLSPPECLSPPLLPVLGECLFFNSLIVGLPYSSIFYQFWLVFVFKFVVVLLLVV